MRAIAGLWRWRHNPLRRRTDLLEAWVALVTVLLIAAGAPAAGVAAGTLSERALLRTAEEQHRERHPVTATVLRLLRDPTTEPDPEAVSGRSARGRVMATWRAPDGTVRRGTVTTGPRSLHPGDRFTIWTDRHGSVVMRPLTAVTASVHAALAGLGVAVALAALLEGIRRLIMWRIVRRRHVDWDRAWEKAGPDWGRTGADS